MIGNSGIGVGWVLLLVLLLPAATIGSTDGELGEIQRNSSWTMMVSNEDEAESAEEVIDSIELGTFAGTTGDESMGEGTERKATPFAVEVSAIVEDVAEEEDFKTKNEFEINHFEQANTMAQPVDVVIGSQGGLRALVSTTEPLYRPETSHGWQISGFGFRDNADVEITNDSLNKEANNPTIRCGANVVYAKADMVGKFFAKVAPAYRKSGISYVLVTHNSDKEVTQADSLKEFSQPTNPPSGKREGLLLHWFGQNIAPHMSTLGLPITPLPIGLPNARKKSPEIYGNHSLGGPMEEKSRGLSIWLAPMTLAGKRRGKRVVLLNALKKGLSSKQFGDAPIDDDVRKRYPLQQYMSILQEYLFTYAPIGNGLDTHRLWETLYAGGIAVVNCDRFWVPAKNCLAIVCQKEYIAAWQKAGEDGLRELANMAGRRRNPACLQSNSWYAAIRIAANGDPTCGDV